MNWTEPTLFLFTSKTINHPAAQGEVPCVVTWQPWPLGALVSGWIYWVYVSSPLRTCNRALVVGNAKNTWGMRRFRNVIDLV